MMGVLGSAEPLYSLAKASAIGEDIGQKQPKGSPRS
jgi:hypothetical protein